MSQKSKVTPIRKDCLLFGKDIHRDSAKFLDPVDEYNLRQSGKGTQFTKNVKLRESTYNILQGIIKNDFSGDIRTLDDAVFHTVLIASMVGSGMYTQDESDN